MIRAVIMIGASGSGKTTEAREMAEGFNGGPVVVCSADDYPGLYADGRICVELLGDAHAACLRRWINALVTHADDGVDTLLICDNTNTTQAEIAPYIATARSFGVEPEIVYMDPGLLDVLEGTPLPQLEQMAARAKHGTPPHVVMAQALRAEDLVCDWPPFWPEVEYQAVTL